MSAIALKPIRVRLGLKWCAGCGEVKPAVEFALRRGKGDQRRSYCHPCEQESKRATRAKARESAVVPPPLPVEPEPTPVAPVPLVQEVLPPPGPPAPLASVGRVPHDLVVDYLIELICLHCGRRIGDYVAQSPLAPLVTPYQPRCRTCGGSAVPSGEVARRVREEPRRLDDDPFALRLRLRRGRPSFALLEARRLDRLAVLEAEALG